MLGAVAVARSPRDIGIPATVLAAICVVALGLWRLFPDPGHYPFPTTELIAALVFCSLGAGLTWRVERARVLHILFLAYGVACAVAYLVPTNLGGNVVRLRLVAVPIAILVLSLRRWRPLPIAVIAMGLALSWNLTPLAYSFFQTRHDPAASATYWQPVVRYLHTTLTPDYRVEAVDTSDHWEAVYLPQAGIPIVRGWFRQNDFPLNELLYDNMTPAGLRRLAPPAERALRRPHRLDAGLQRPAGGRAPRERPLRPAGRLPLDARHRVLGALAAADRHRPGPPAGRFDHREHRHAPPRRSRGHTRSGSASRPTCTRTRAASASPRTG